MPCVALCTPLLLQGLSVQSVLHFVLLMLPPLLLLRCLATCGLWLSCRLAVILPFICPLHSQIIKSRAATWLPTCQLMDSALAICTAHYSALHHHLATSDNSRALQRTVSTFTAVSKAAAWSTHPPPSSSNSTQATCPASCSYRRGTAVTPSLHCNCSQSLHAVVLRLALRYCHGIS